MSSPAAEWASVLFDFLDGMGWLTREAGANRAQIEDGIRRRLNGIECPPGGHVGQLGMDGFWDCCHVSEFGLECDEGATE